MIRFVAMRDRIGEIAAARHEGTLGEEYIKLAQAMILCTLPYSQMRTPHHSQGRTRRRVHSFCDVLCSSGEVAKALGVSTGKLGPRRDSLVKKGMLYSPACGDVAFTVPLFDAFMKRVMPE